MIGRLTGKWQRRIVAVAMVAIYGFIMLAGAYVTPALRAHDVRTRAESLIAEIEALQVDDLTTAKVDQLRSRIDTIGADLSWLRLFLHGDPLLNVVRQLGIFDQAASDAESILVAADDVHRAATVVLEVARGFTLAREEAGLSGEQLLSRAVGLMASSTDEFDTAYDYLAAARDRLESVSNDSPFSSDRGLILGGLEKYFPLLEQVRTVDDMIPGLVGWTGTKRYLVLAQDPAELRPTGGYSGTIGVVAFTDGKMTERSFQDVYQLDLLPGVPYVEPPSALANHLLGNASWQLADANWSPDFPTSAQNALRLYTLESGDADIDGVIALTTYAVDRLLEVTGPVDVPEYNVTVGAGEVTLTALGLTRGISTPTSDRKAFLEDLTTAVLQKLYALPPASWPAMFNALGDLGERRDLLVWLKDGGAQAVVAPTPMGGRVRQDATDYLYVVEANVAPTSKYNLVIDRHDKLEVTIEPDGDVVSRLQMDWVNNALTEGEPYTSIREYSTSHAGVYGTFTRVLIPTSSTLTSVDGAALDPVESPEEAGTEAGRAYFGNFLLMGPGGAHLNASWMTPTAASNSNGRWTYVLTVQKQPGLRPMPVDVRIVLPVGARVVDATAGAAVEGHLITVSTTTRADFTIGVTYTLP